MPCCKIGHSVSTEAKHVHGVAVDSTRRKARTPPPCHDPCGRSYVACLVTLAKRQDCSCYTVLVAISEIGMPCLTFWHCSGIAQALPQPLPSPKETDDPPSRPQCPTRPSTASTRPEHCLGHPTPLPQPLRRSCGLWCASPAVPAQVRASGNVRPVPQAMLDNAPLRML